MVSPSCGAVVSVVKFPYTPLSHCSAGILWNLSSSDNLKDRLARDTLEKLTDLVLIPLSGTGNAALIQQNASEAEIFYNATGFLRYFSLLKERHIPWLVDPYKTL